MFLQWQPDENLFSETEVIKLYEKDLRSKLLLKYYEKSNRCRLLIASPNGFIVLKDEIQSFEFVLEMGDKLGIPLIVIDS